MYIPLMIAMIKPEFIQYSCYKFMFLLGLIDLVAVPADCIIGGFQAITGIHYCSNPTFFFLVGCVSISKREKELLTSIFLILGCYFGATMVCVLLAINRFCDMLFPNVARIIFGNKVMPFWFLVALGYMVYFWYNVPTVFNVVYLANYLDPFMGVPGFEGNQNVKFFQNLSKFSVGIEGTWLLVISRIFSVWHIRLASK
jgi:hypothetical protein